MVDELLAKQPDLAALQVKQLQAKAETGIKNGSLKGSMWKGPWKLRSPGFFEFIGKPLNGVMLKEEHRVAFVMGWRHSFAVMGSARLFEESSFAVRLVGRDTTVQQGLEMIILQTLERSLTTDEIENLGKSVRPLSRQLSRFSLILCLGCDGARSCHRDHEISNRNASRRFSLVSSTSYGRDASQTRRQIRKPLPVRHPLRTSFRATNSLSALGILELCTTVRSLCITEE